MRTALRLVPLRLSADKLNKTTQEENWDRVKIVCTQPFNKSTTYGLSFIKFHSVPGMSTPAQKEGVKKLGAFFVKKEDGDEEDDIKVGMLFATKAKKEATVSPSPTAAIRTASRLAEESRPSTSRASPNRGSLSASSQSKATPPPVKATPPPVKATPLPVTASPTISKPIHPKKHDVSDEDNDTEEESPVPRPALKRQSSSLSSVNSAQSPHAPPLKKTKTEPPKASPAKQFSRLMEKVTFVLSGFQNPYRGHLRDKAVEMGATYKPDWGNGCTHLICAFTNTPKFKQVQGKGRIVSKEWINNCYKQKQLLSWRKYRLGDAETPDESSGEEEEEFTPGRKTAGRKTPEVPRTGTRMPDSIVSKKTPENTNRKTPPPADDNDDKGCNKFGGDSDSADDTDEEIKRAQQKAERRAHEMIKSPGKVKAEVIAAPEPDNAKPESEPDNATLDLFDDSTDEDEQEPDNDTTIAIESDSEVAGKDTDSEADSGLPDLPDFFSDKHFFFYGDFNAAEKRLLTRYIAAYNGVLEDYMNDRVKFVVTSSRWDDNFKQVLSENCKLVFVKPQWIHSCHHKCTLLPHQPYIVVP